MGSQFFRDIITNNILAVVGIAAGVIVSLAIFIFRPASSSKKRRSLLREEAFQHLHTEGELEIIDTSPIESTLSESWMDYQAVIQELVAEQLIDGKKGSVQVRGRIENFVVYRLTSKGIAYLTEKFGSPPATPN